MYAHTSRPLYTLPHSYVVRNGHLSEQQARWIFQQLIVAVDYLHRKGVANRDIKLENTLLVGNPDRPLVKVGGWVWGMGLHVWVGGCVCKRGGGC